MDSEPDDSLNMDSNAKSKKRKANKRQSKDVNMRDDSNLDVDVEQNLDLTGNTEANADKKSKRKRGKKGVCVKCNETKTVYYKSMCSNCYEKHLKTKHEKEGRQESKNLIICLKCNLLKKHKARQLCLSCYMFARKSKKLNQYSTTRVKSLIGQQGVCVKCNQSKTLVERFMCRACYEKDKRAKRKAGAQKCGNCGRFEVLELNGFCSECNSDKRIRKMADEFGIYQDLETILKSIENNESILSAHLTIHVNLSSYAKYFEQFSKIKFSFMDLQTLDEINDANLDEENVGPSKYSIQNEEFIGRLKQYTRSKLKPLKKQNNSSNTENASSIFNVSEKSTAKSISKARQLSKIKIPSKPRNFNLKECVDCKQMKLHEARGRCSACYQRFMRQKKKEDAEKAKIIEQTKEKSSQNVEARENNVDQEEAPSGKPKKKRAKKQSTDA